jgi:hypothetical protein
MTELSGIARVVPPGWKQMASGKGVDLARPEASVVDFNDIAIGLSLLCRFTGAMRSPAAFYPVAVHSVLVAMLLPPDWQLRGLLHDAHEAYFGDDSTPKKNLLAVTVPMAADAVRDLKWRWDLAIWEAARMVPPTAEESAAVKAADHMALAIERRDLLNPPADDMTRQAWAWLPEPNPHFRVSPTTPENAHQLFTRALGALLWGEGGAA